MKKMNEGSLIHGSVGGNYGIISEYKGETPSDKGALAEAVSWQEKNMENEIPSETMPDRAMIRKYKGK